MPVIYDEPSRVAAVDGSVTVDGPGGVAVALTPEAAAETSQRLLDSAAEASAQLRFATRDEAAQRARHTPR